jgi:hypothetical protein
MWRVPKGEGELVLCRECPRPRRKEKLSKSMEFSEALSAK